MEKKCKHCSMMIPKEANICPHCRKRVAGISPAIIIIGIFFSLFVLFMLIRFINIGSKASQSTQGTSTKSQLDSNASDDGLFREVKRCMDLQYSLRPDWLPSDTNKSALCIGNAKNSCGEERVKKTIGLWLAQPRSIEYMTLLNKKDVTLLNKASAAGIESSQVREYMIDLMVANVAIYMAKNGQ